MPCPHGEVSHHCHRVSESIYTNSSCKLVPRSEPQELSWSSSHFSPGQQDTFKSERRTDSSYMLRGVTGGVNHASDGSSLQQNTYLTDEVNANNDSSMSSPSIGHKARAEEDSWIPFALAPVFHLPVHNRK